MLVESCMPVVPSADLERSLRFWVEGLRSRGQSNHSDPVFFRRQKIEQPAIGKAG